VVITVLVMSVIPWTLTTSGPFVLAPAITSELVAPDSGIVAAVYVREGTRVPAGAPLVRIVNRGLEGELLSAARAVDSLSAGVSRARALDQTAFAAQLDEERAAALNRLAGMQSRIDALSLRARWSGVVTTAHVEALEGMRVYAGTRILTIAMIDSLEARIALDRLGATRVRAGDTARLVTYADPGHPIGGSIVDVSPAGHGSSGTGPGAIDVRIPVRVDGPWHAGATGEAKVELQRSTMLAALWWAIRQRIRSDILL
jgi:multidrug efflux pump subunit AcrA (membrane-fusion protein)